MKTIQILGLMSVVFTSFIYPNAYAQETTLKPKSVTTAWILALDPIPADALYYSGHNKQATGDLILALGGILIGFSGWVVAEADHFYTTNGEALSISTASPRAKALFGLGIGMYASSLIWDGIGGIHYANKHNKELEKSKEISFLNTFRPVVGVESGGGFVGGQFRF